MSETFDKKQGILIDLDALLDTRLGVINSYGEEIMFKIIENGYNKREIDDFEGIDRADFKDRYSKRDKHTLKNSMVTRCSLVIKELVMAMTKQALTSPFHTGPKIFVNFYPYVLEEPEKEVIISAIVAMTNKLADVELIRLDNSEVTPGFLKEHVAIVFKYEYGSWLDAQAENFKTSPCPEIGVIVPSIYSERLPTEQELNDSIEKFKHPFRLMELLSSPLIGLKLSEVEMFCANIK